MFVRFSQLSKIRLLKINDETCKIYLDNYYNIFDIIFFKYILKNYNYRTTKFFKLSSFKKFVKNNFEK